MCLILIQEEFVRAPSPFLTSQRLQSHKAAKTYLDSGNYPEAESILSEATQKFGPHVLLLTDLAQTYLMQNKMIKFCETVFQIQHEFNLSDSHLSEDSYCLTALFLGSAYEKMASHDQALKMYEQAFFFAFENEDLHQFAHAEMNRVRKVLNVQH